MAIQTRQKFSLTEFEAFIEHPDNSEAIFEFINGEIIEVPSNPYSSKLAGIIFGELYIYLKSNDIGHLTGEAGGYMIDGERYAPDVAFISYKRQPELAKSGYNPNPPELAIEVVSDSSNAEEQRNLRLKVSHYLVANVTVWVIDPAEQIVEVHSPGKAAQELNREEALSAESILPGFKLELRQIFPAPENTN